MSVIELVNLYLLRDHAARMGMERTHRALCLLIEELRRVGAGHEFSSLR